MHPFKIVTDSSCDIPDELVKLFDLEVVPYYVTLDGVNYLKEKEEISVDDFFEQIKSKSVFPKTSLPTIHDFSDVFRKYLEKGIDVLCFCLTSKFSGSYQSAINAKNILGDEFPERKIHVVDSVQATFAQGLLVLEAAKLNQAGISLENTVELVESEKSKARIFVTTATLEYLQRGGRIGKASALAGSLLNIKPILCLKDGELFPIGKCRGMKKTLTEMSDLAMKNLVSIPEDYVFSCAYSGTKDKADEAVGILKERHGISLDYPICKVGITIGSHIGGDVVGIVYAKKFNTQ